MVLSGGTLLGFYRDGDFIPWDWDVEVTVLTEEAIDKHKNILNALVNSGFLIRSFDLSFENFKIVATGWGTEYEILGRYFRQTDKTRVRLMTKVPAKFFEKSKILRLRGQNFPVPSPVEEFLNLFMANGEHQLNLQTKKVIFLNKLSIKKKKELSKN